MGWVLSILGVCDVLCRLCQSVIVQVFEFDSILSSPSLDVDLLIVYKDAKRLTENYDLLFACLDMSNLHVFPVSLGVVLLNPY